MTALLNPGDSLLIPQPGFSLYTTLALSYGYVPRYYDLRPDQHWQADLDHAASLVDATTRVLIGTDTTAAWRRMQRARLTCRLQ